MRVVVYHSFYGCDTGCCGHIVKVDDEQIGSFDFSHPYGDARSFAEDLVREACREERIADVDAHVADLDWESCVILDD